MYTTSPSARLGRCADLSDDAFVAAFEDLSLSNERFGHVDHVRLAWIYLRRMPLLDAIGRFRDGLLRFATAHGAPEKYHETVTWAFVILIHERLHDGGWDLDWLGFADGNPDLLEWRSGALFDYYGPSLLESDVARAIFVLPRPAARPGHDAPDEARGT